ncbi:hypothetical protein GCM10009730_17100 [Streptomyces albidochromogenes]|uniref:Uncharacterized protein n=1 Tax=Streptomyces chryseus TaxID=68186 RepID=A0ABQ3DGN7_9ACTN|nr:hypothetical protein GCM10010353_16260 [Streptomyces chryseus]GHA87057.1 hypothetical protein GCM10010346_07120 [Streptomyces chryseus]
MPGGVSDRGAVLAAYPGAPVISQGDTDWRSTPLLALMYVSQRAHAPRDAIRWVRSVQRSNPL